MASSKPISFPTHGRDRSEILTQMRSFRKNDLKWHEGSVFSLVFFAGEEVHQVAQQAYNLFFSENGLNPTAFPSLRRMETEVIAMSAALLGGDEETAGNMTSGGTESILLSVLTAREWAKIHRPSVQVPEIILARSAHPAFAKAAHYFGLKIINTAVLPDLRADVAAVRKAVTPDTILIVGSAPSYPHGVVDPIGSLAEVAQEHGILCHVDACVGGFMLPFVHRLGYPVPAFDFQVPGVTSISADLHKYGYAAKGASVILYRHKEIRRFQMFAEIEWPGGIYASPTLAGTRPGGSIAAAWAVMQHLGEEGYCRIARQVMEATEILRQGIEDIEGVQVLGDPVMSLMALGSTTLNIYEIGDELGLRGWHLDRQQFPPSLHLTINFAHISRTADFLQDLASAVAAARKPTLRKVSNQLLLGTARTATKLLPKQWVSRLTSRATALVGAGGGEVPSRSAAMYGMMGTLPNRGDLHEVVLDLVEQFTELQKGP